MLREEININAIKQAVQLCCQEKECVTCKGKECLVGFAKLVSEYAGAKKALSIPNGLKMVPTGDFKVYDPDDMAFALATINHECKNCQDSHDNNCVINIIRSSLEVALLGEHSDFTGNPLMYVMNLSQVNPELGEKVLSAYRQLKSQ